MSVSEAKPALDAEGGAQPRRPAVLALFALAMLALSYFLFREVGRELYRAYTLVDSYYTHGFIVPLVSAFFAWRLWPKLRVTPAVSSPAGYPLVAAAAVLLLLGDYLGFRIFTQAAILPMAVGVCLLVAGVAWTRILWFPLGFLVFMIPIPASITQSLALNLKLFAAKCAVELSTALGLPMVQEGSYIYFRDDFLIVGEVCGGLRSLIALLAFGALMAYLSKATPAARVFLFLMGAPIALAANILRIFALCVVGYYYGSDVAAGTVHDVSGYMIFAVAFVLFFALDSLVKRWFTRKTPESGGEAEGGPAAPFSPRPLHLGILVAIVAATTALHVQSVQAQERATAEAKAFEGLDIPEYIGNFKQMGVDEEIDDHVKAVLETSEILIRPYTHAATGYPVQLTIVYAGTTRRSLHFPEVCLVGAGWEVREQSADPINLDLTARRLILVKGETQQAVLYWFKTGDLLTGNFFLNAFEWAKNQLTGDASTSAMIKVAASFKPGYEEEAFAILREYAASVSKVALERIP